MLESTPPQGTVNVWNKVSADCVHSSSVKIFKEGIREGRNMFIRQYDNIQYLFIRHKE